MQKGTRSMSVFVAILDQSTLIVNEFMLIKWITEFVKAKWLWPENECDSFL